MKKILIRSISILPVLALIAAISGCSWIKNPFTPTPTPASAPAPARAAEDSSIINIEAGSLSFKPAVVRVEKPGPFILQVKNLTGSEKSLTLKDPLGKVMKTLRIGAKSTSISNIELPAPGSYEFQGGKLLGVSLGRKGRIVVGPAK